jgi:RNA polymerase sigma factor (TIGR02999 family)
MAVVHINSTDVLLQTVYTELKQVARKQLTAERADHTLQATALVNEVCLRMYARPVGVDWQSRSHFLRTAAEAMRRILVDHARHRLAAKRGGRNKREPVEDLPIELPLSPEELISIHDCLDRFELEDPVKAQLVKLRVFGGFSHQEAAEALGFSRQTADRYWKYAKVRLRAMLS